jgi:hypothetical protein
VGAPQAVMINALIMTIEIAMAAWGIGFLAFIFFLLSKTKKPRTAVVRGIIGFLVQPGLVPWPDYANDDRKLS